MSAEATGFVHFELAEIRRSSLLVAAFLTCGVGYTWLLFTVWPETGGPSPASASWCGGTVAIMSALAALKLRHRYLTAASCVLVIGVLVGVACAVFLLGPAHSFLFIIPIAVASVFLERSAFYAVVSVVVGLVVIRVFHHVGNASEGAGTSAGSTTVGTALATVAVASAASWLSAHRFQIALRATCIGYERARQNSELARTRQGEVSRALKSLEEASYRLTRSNYELGLARARAEEPVR